MPRSNALVRCAFVVTLALALVACGAAGPTPPPNPIFVPGPTPVKSVAVGAQYAEALVAAFAGDPVMHLVETAKLKGLYELDGVNVSLTATLDISGRDMDFHIVTKAAGKTTEGDLVVVGKTVFARFGGDPWKKVRRSDFEQQMADIVRGLQLIRDPTALAYVGLETIDKHKLHHLRATRTLPYTNGNGMSGTYDKFDVWVKEDGTPVLVKGKISTVGAYGLEVSGTTEMRFSKFGGPIKIVAPKN
jgi:hypothetical protein